MKVTIWFFAILTFYSVLHKKVCDKRKDDIYIHKME